MKQNEHGHEYQVMIERLVNANVAERWNAGGRKAHERERWNAGRSDSAISCQTATRMVTEERLCFHSRIWQSGAYKAGTIKVGYS